MPYSASSRETDLRLLARYRPVQQWWQNRILSQRMKKNSENVLAGLENISLPCRKGEMKGMWLPCASLPLFCSMSNVKTFLYPELLPLFWGGTWTGTGWALSWICSRVAQLSLELGRSLDGVTQKWCLPLPLCWQCQLHFLPVPQGSWDLCAAARKTWHAHEIESLCWAIDAGPFLQVPCCPTFTGSASSLAYGWSYLDAAKESIRASRVMWNKKSVCNWCLIVL